MSELKRIKAGQTLTKEEIIKLLSVENEEMELLFSQARAVRKEIFHNRIFMYGFVYFTTWCRNDCNFCYFRKSNEIERYRKTSEEIIQIAIDLKNSGIHLIDLTMGEDDTYHNENFTSLLSIVKEIKNRTKLPVMISTGVINHDIIDQFSNLNTQWYALYQETHNRELFSKLRKDQDYDERMNAKLHAISQGMLVEEGILTGVGERLEDIADSILEMGKIGARQVRVMSFIPQKGSPMENVTTPDRTLELKIIAILRLLYPNFLIPATLDVDGIGGLRDRMNAGANVVTSIIPPKIGLAGVAQSSMDVDDGGRTVEEASLILKSMGLEVATSEEYLAYISSLHYGSL